MQALSANEYAAHVINESIIGEEVNESELAFEQIVHSPEIQQQVLARTMELHPASLPMVQQLLADPERSHIRFLTFFSQYWETCMLPEWPQLEALLLQDIEHRGPDPFPIWSRRHLSFSGTATACA